MTSPFGPYGPMIASITGVMIVLSAIILHTLPGFLIAVGIANSVPTETSWMDNAALLVVGIVFGTRTGMNGAGQIALAAHERLDRIGAPSADAAIMRDGAR